MRSPSPVAFLHQITRRTVTDMACNADEQIGAALAPLAEDCHGTTGVFYDA